MQNSPSQLSVAEVASAIGIPTDRWPGNCYGIACAIVDAGLVSGKPVYGHWRGPIAEGSHFANRIGLGFVHHGWIELESGEVLDSTRWVFENVAPYLYLGSEDDAQNNCICGHLSDDHQEGFFAPCEARGCSCDDLELSSSLLWPYDSGGQVLREQMERPAPELAPSDNLCTLSFETKQEAQSVASLGVGKLQGQDLILGIRQAHWLATLSLRRLGVNGVPLYRALINAELSGLVPIDNREILLGSTRKVAA